MKCFSCMKTLAKEQLFFWRAQTYCERCIEGLGGTAEKEKTIEAPANRVTTYNQLFGYVSAIAVVICWLIMPTRISQIFSLVVIFINIINYSKPVQTKKSPENECPEMCEIEEFEGNPDLVDEGATSAEVKNDPTAFTHHTKTSNRNERSRYNSLRDPHRF